MNYNVRIDDNFLRGDHVDGEVLQHTDLNELENVAKTAINANYEDIQKLQNGDTLAGNATQLDGASLSKFATETLQNSDAKVPTSAQVKQYIDGELSHIDLSGYYTKREIDETLEDYPTFTDYPNGIKAGVIKTSAAYGTDVNENGVLRAGWDAYNTYRTRDEKCFISKGTLEGVIEGKGLINNNTEGLVHYYTKEEIDEVTQAIPTTFIDGGDTYVDYINLNTIPFGFYEITGGMIIGENVYSTSGSYAISVGDWVNDKRKILRLDDNWCYTIEREKIGSNYDYWVSYDKTDSGGGYKGTPIVGNDMANYYTKSEVDAAISAIDLTDYVKNTNYATPSKAGVIKSGYNGLQVDSTNGKTYCDTYSYANYGNVENQRFISKGTLENVITGKGLINNQVNNLTNYYTKTEIDSTIGDLETILETLDTGEGI